ncbi:MULTISPECIES: DUF904 domain-containing protein [unclassified Undibacterium]|uniref:DUF904 domain-containing protein n=3 Tax=Pseudomonadota TaxID=1224 RepID=UPI002AC8FF2F|nr:MULTISPECIES: DUF904 domain-containing protein [unclassified Undibacterium]MEB0137628.1 DUF904 domain-containing protein [Undibacterium sp. CCC2.1]MEB0170629.1 DUF904 domain-containing protein [Undibacterium sp. CCC1.1]MEB0174570.1 DUF904 domain-containing protein [Undibacterium sp. CCC3.4]WPX43801.1 DUF904 domain-containing protein [Undibacterium sp. CCC3.4]
MMISDFQLLAEKVAKLSELTHALRAENAGLRHELLTLTAQNLGMQQRMQEAHARTSALLSQLPAEIIEDEEAV